MRKVAKLDRENRMARAVDEAVRTLAQRDRRDVVPEKNSESIRDNCDVGRARQRSSGAAGRNTDATITPAVAINIVR